MTTTTMYWRKKYSSGKWQPVSNLAVFLEPSDIHAEGGAIEEAHAQIKELQSTIGKLLALLVEQKVIEIEAAIDISGQGAFFEVEFFKEGDAP